MTETRDASSRWWRGRRLRLFVLIGILVALVVAVGLDVWTRRVVDTEIARLESKYGSLESDAGQQPPVLDVNNRARTVRAAAALANYGAAGISEVRDSLGAFKKLSEPAQVPDDLRAFVEANQSALRIADEASRQERADWKASYSLGTNMPPLVDLRTLSNAMYVAARLESDAGRPDEATRTVMSGLAVADSIRDEPALIAQLIRMAVAHEQFDAVEQLITHANPSETALSELARWLRETGEPDPIRVGLLGELRYINAALSRLDRADQTQMGEGPFLSGWQVRIRRPFLRLGLVRRLQRLDAQIETQDGPRPRPPSPAPTPPGWLDMGLGGSGLDRAIESGDLFTSALAATEIGVALRRYRLARGTYPDEPSALVPAYLTQLPLDPFTGQPPVYARSGAGFVLTAETGDDNMANFSAFEWTVLR